MLQRISRRFDACVVAAPGPSLSEEVARKCSRYPVIAVNDAYRLFPDARVLYGCDESWWDYRRGCPEFSGEKWSSQGNAFRDDKRRAASTYGLNLVKGVEADGFSYDPSIIHYGNNSGFQAINLAGFMTGWGTIILVGFDMRVVNGLRHFFGDYPEPLTNTTSGYKNWPAKFELAAKSLPPTCRIINCTPDSALTCFERASLDDVISKRAA